MTSSRFGPLRARDFRSLWLGHTVSEIGSQVTIIALPLVAVVTLQASAFQVGVLTAAGHAAWLLIGLPAGVWVDRVRRRRMLVAADAGRALLLASIPVAFALGALTLTQLYVVALLTGVLTVLFETAVAAYLPSIVARDDFVTANGMLHSSRSAARIGGPGLGGLLVRGFGASFGLLADAVSFIISAVCVMRIRAVETRPVRGEGGAGRWRRDLVTGLRIAYGVPLLRALAVGLALANLLLAANEAIVIVFLSRGIGLPAGQIGALFAAGGVGGVVGGLLAGPVARRVGAGRALLLGVIVMAPARLLVPLTGSGWRELFFVGGMLVFGTSLSIFNANVSGFIQSAVTSDLLGRVTTSIRFVSRGTLALGGLAGGALAGWLGLRPALWVLAVAWLMVPVWLLASPLRGMRDLPETLDGR